MGKREKGLQRQRMKKLLFYLIFPLTEKENVSSTVSSNSISVRVHEKYYEYLYIYVKYKAYILYGRKYPYIVYYLCM